ncbi:MAG: glycosyltransferase family 2 protein [Candidatus Melainabacteria bacterium]|nr:glycosyltransferase family 2 protein [Candidatus Melainabacteria bacterium]
MLLKQFTDATPATRTLTDYKYSVVIPVFNSESTLTRVLQRVEGVFANNGCNYEIIAVNDGSTDSSWRLLKKAAAANKRIIAIDLVKNYGQHIAIFCGLTKCSGDYILTIDDDLQNPPEEMLKLINCALEEDVDLVCAKFLNKKHPFFRRMGSGIISALNERLFAKPKYFAISNFRLMSSSLVKRICGHRTAFPYITGLALKYAGTMRNVSVEHHERLAGTSQYTPLRIATLVLTILFSYSSFPLKLVCTIGVGVSFFSFVLACGLVFKTLLFKSAVPGWTSIVVLMSFFNGMLMLMLGMLGEYVVRILNTISTAQCYEIRDIAK